MRKLVAMVLALCMVMCCVPAFATLTLPEISPTMADVSGAERPEMPAYSASYTLSASTQKSKPPIERVVLTRPCKDLTLVVAL